MVVYLQLLSSENVPVQDVADLFLKTFIQNQEIGTIQFVELLFNAGGWMDFDYQKDKNPSTEHFMKIRKTNDLLAPISSQENNFQRKFTLFLNIVLESSSAQLIYNHYFMLDIMTVYLNMSTGEWDMSRLVAQILGMKVLHAINKEYEKIKRHYISDNQSVSTLKSANYQESHASFLQVYNLVQFFVFRTLCHKCQSQGSLDVMRSPFCRLSNFVNEIMISTVSLDKDNKERWMMTILSGLRDQNPHHRGICHLALFLLLCREENPRWQLRVFNYVKSDLIYTLRFCSDLAVLTLRIISSVVRYMRIELSDFELDTIYFYIYSKNQTLAILAGEIVYDYHAIDSDPMKILRMLREVANHSFDKEMSLFKNITNFDNEKCIKIESEDFLMDAIIQKIKPNFTWTTWMICLQDCEEEEIYDFMKLFSAFIRKVTTGYIPKYRTVISREMSSSTVLTIRNEFSAVFIRGFFTLLEITKLSDDPRALALLMRVPQYFVRDIISEKKQIVDIARVCTALIYIGKEPSLIEESCLTLYHIQKLTMFDTVLQPLIKILVTATTINTFKNFYQFNFTAIDRLRIVNCAKYFDVGDHYKLWQSSMDMLCQLWCLRTSNDELIMMLFLFLCEILKKRADTFVGDSLNENRGLLYINENNAINRAASLQEILCRFLTNGHHKHSPQVKRAAFETILLLFEFIVANSSAIPVKEWKKKSYLNSRILGALIYHALKLFKVRKECQSLHIHLGKMPDCCSAILRFCSASLLGIYDYEFLALVLQQIGVNDVHDEIIANAIMKYAEAYEQKWEVLAELIYNAFITIIERYINCEPKDPNIQAEEVIRNLYQELETLTKFFVTAVKLRDTRILKRVSIRLHRLLIDMSINEGGWQPSFELLYSVRGLLAQEDVNHILSYLNGPQFKPNEDVKKYYNFLKQA